MKRPWQDFSHAVSESFVRGLVDEARTVPAQDLVAMASYRREERMAACRGHDPIRIVLAYAQDELAYDEKDNLITVTGRTEYRNLPRERRLNKFGLAYRRDAAFWLNRTLADIVVGAAIHLYQAQQWRTVLYDGLRTVEGAFNLYNFATDKDIADGLLALPGQSAHNKGLAVDSMMEDANGREVEMGGHFDHLDMKTNARTYENLSPAILEHRRIREAAFLRSAFAQGLLVAPLRAEFWDDRLPENRADLWRVLDSAARCLKIKLLSEEEENLRKTNRAVFAATWEHWSYGDFLNRWHEVFKGREAEVENMLGTPPLKEQPEFYHGNWHPIYDRDLLKSGKHLTLPAAA